MKNLALALTSLLLTLMLLEGGLRALEAWRAGEVSVENQFMRATNVGRAFRRETVDGIDLYVRTEAHWIPQWVRFPAEKDPDTFRVFCLGGSAAMGWPHPGEWAYPAQLERKLARLFPGRRFEVVNAAGNTYASYRVKVVFDEILDYEPDVVVVYSGNNEFLENVVYRPLHLGLEEPGPLDALALGRFVEGRLGNGDLRKRTVDFGSYGNRDQVSNRLSFAFGRASELRTDPDQFETVSRHYAYNLEEMVRTGRERGIPVVLATVPVNLRDWRPNVSISGVQSEERVAERRRALRSGYEKLDAGEPAQAVVAFERAVSIDPDYATSWFDLGRALLMAGRAEEAKERFQGALERDAYPFRSIFNDVVEDVARRTGAPLAGLVRALERHSDDGMIGLDLMVDYVHPTVAANELIAQEVLEAFAEGGLLPGKPALASSLERLDPPDAVELGEAAFRALFGQILIMRQYELLEEVGPRLRRVLVERAPTLSPREQGWNTDAIERLDRTMQVVRPYRELLQAEELGTVEQHFTPEEAEAIFADYVSLIQEVEGKHVSDSEFATYLPERKARRERPPWRASRAASSFSQMPPKSGAGT